MNESTLFQGTVIFAIGNVDTKVSKTPYRDSSLRLSLSLKSSKFICMQSTDLRLFCIQDLLYNVESPSFFQL
jgi:hypothetical protein